jgi:hypothetical protein
VILQHVLERAGSVVVAGAPLECERLLPEDLDFFDVVAVPCGIEERVRESEREEILNARHSEDVVDSEDEPFAFAPQQLDEELVERNRAREVRAERLLEHDPAARRQSGRRNGCDGRREEAGRKG